MTLLPTRRWFRFRNLTLCTVILLVSFSWTVLSAADTSKPYAGLENRGIKSLSEDDLRALRKGAGWGLALPAELNGLPGPLHLLELKNQIGLDEDQVREIEASYMEMQNEARIAGEKFITAEAALDVAFQQGDLNPEDLRQLIDNAGQARAALRFIHLSRHLEMPPLLQSEQIERYNELRGYDGADPCGAVPEGHDPAMWRKHNNC